MMITSRPVHHISYAVPDIQAACREWAALLKAGPFFVFEHVHFDEVTHYGKPCVFDHTAAFGQYGSIFLELQQIHASSPISLTEKMIPTTMPVINHLAYVSPTPEKDSAELTAAGVECFLHAKFGEQEIIFHDTRAALGQAIEIHRESSFFSRFFDGVAAAAANWDGTRVTRPGLEALENRRE